MLNLLTITDKLTIISDWITSNYQLFIGILIAVLGSSVGLGFICKLILTKLRKKIYNSIQAFLVEKFDQNKAENGELSQAFMTKLDLLFNDYTAQMFAKLDEYSLKEKEYKANIYKQITGELPTEEKSLEEVHEIVNSNVESIVESIPELKESIEEKEELPSNDNGAIYVKVVEQ